MKSLYESLIMNESLTDLPSIAEWLSQYEIWRTKIDVSDLEFDGNKVNILPKQPVDFRIKENIPFKIGKLNGTIELCYFNLDTDHIVDECGGISFVGVKGGKKLKDTRIIINSDYQKPRNSSNGVSFWKSAGLLSAMKNVIFDFSKAYNDFNYFNIDILKKNSLKNIELIDCKMIVSNSEAKVTLDDIKNLKGVDKILSNSGDTENFSFTFDGKKWRVGKN